MKETSVFEYVQKGMEDNIFNKTINGKCSQCGECCGNFLPLSRKEIDVIHKYIKKHHIKEFKHLFPTVTPSLDFMCPFLDTDKKCEKCRIYDVRPMICKKFICDSEQRAKLTREEVGNTRMIVDMRSEFYGSESII